MSDPFLSATLFSYIGGGEIGWRPRNHQRRLLRRLRPLPVAVMIELARSYIIRFEPGSEEAPHNLGSVKTVPLRDDVKTLQRLR